MGALTKIPKHTRPISFTMGYRYKRKAQGNIVERKARCSAIGDEMIPRVHFYPENPRHIWQTKLLYDSKFLWRQPSTCTLST